MEKMPDKAFGHFLALFRMYPDYEFLWKFESPTEAHINKLKEHRNVHIKSWLNQIALLGKMFFIANNLIYYYNQIMQIKFNQKNEKYSEIGS
jgi:hypothetical protein